MRPESAPCSLRGHGTTVTSTKSAGSCCSASATMAVREEPPRSDPRGPIPAVTVMRIRASGTAGDASITASAPARIWSRSGSGIPRPAAERASRARCRVSANGLPAGDLDRLEDAVAHHEAVVEDRDPGLVVGEKLPIHPDSHVPDASARRPLGKGLLAAWRAVSFGGAREALPWRRPVAAYPGMRVCPAGRIGYSSERTPVSVARRRGPEALRT